MSRSVDAIQADIDLFVGLRSQIGVNGIAEYTMDTGQGSQRVRRVSVAEIRQTLRDLEAELLDAQTTGPVSVTFDRGGRY